MNRRASIIVTMLVVAGLAPFFIFSGSPQVAWERQLLEKEYVHCLAIHEESDRSILVAGIQQNKYGSRDYDNYIVCFDLASGEELWRRYETKERGLRGWKRPATIDFCPSGELIVGWKYSAVREGDYEVVSKLSAKDGELVWDWTAPSEGDRPRSVGFKHGGWAFCDGPEILVKTSRSVGSDGRKSDVRDFYTVIDSSTGKPTTSSATAEARWSSKSNSLAYIAADGSEVTWDRHSYEHTEVNWFNWSRDDGILMPETHWERRERVQVTRISPHKPGPPEQFFIGRERERAILLLYGDSSPEPAAALLIDLSEREVEARSWRVVSVIRGRKLGRTLARGIGVSHNYDGPMRFTESGTVAISGSLLHDQSRQKITVWK